MGKRVGVFTVVLTLGDGSKVEVETRMRIRASMREEEIAIIKGVDRREAESRGVPIRWTVFGRQLMHRDT